MEEQVFQTVFRRTTLYWSQRHCVPTGVLCDIRSSLVLNWEKRKIIIPLSLVYILNMLFITSGLMEKFQKKFQRRIKKILNIFLFDLFYSWIAGFFFYSEPWFRDPRRRKCVKLSCPVALDTEHQIHCGKQIFLLSATLSVCNNF